MKVTSHAEHLREHHADGVCVCGEHHSHMQAQLVQTVAGLALVLNSVLVPVFFSDSESVSGFSAMLGAFVLGFPIVKVAIKDVRGGSLNTNVLVALAVIALFGSGHYQEAVAILITTFGHADHEHGHAQLNLAGSICLSL